MQHVVRPKLSPEEYSKLRAGIARRVNKARGTPEHVQQQIKDLYFQQGITAKLVAEQLHITHGAVRATISRSYALMTVEERKLFGKNAGRWIKGGDK